MSSIARVVGASKYVRRERLSQQSMFRGRDAGRRTMVNPMCEIFDESGRLWTFDAALCSF